MEKYHSLKGFLFIALFGFSTLVMAQLQSNTPAGRIFPKKPTAAINVISPVITPGETWVTPLRTVAISGSVNFNAEKILINGKETKLNSNAGFSHNLKLSAGKQPVSIEAYDKSGKKAEFAFFINCNSDTSGPAITVLEPMIPKKGKINLSEPTIAIRLKAVDNGGISSVLIHGIKATVIGSNEYFANVDLAEGENNITVHATDNFGNSSEKIIPITRLGDIKGPAIVVLEPAVSRGIKAVSKKELIKVRGVVTDESGVEQVTINERKAQLNASGEFELEVALVTGDNRIIIRSMDTKRNVSIDTFIVNRQLEELIAPGKYYAFIVGIDKYSGIWVPLRNAVHDAKGIADVLKKNYKFDEITTLYNEEATRERILDEFEKLVNKINKDDNLLIFYSGHGQLDQRLNKGYWVPVDAGSKSISKLISNSDIQTFLNGIRSRHTLLVSDACFAGDIFRGSVEGVPFEEKSERYIKEVYKLPSRAALTSGGIEPVADGGREGHSVFSYYLIEKLTDNTSKYFVARELFDQLIRPVTNNSEQRPFYQGIKNTGDEGGEFVFIRKNP